jgi:RNA-directed DNA polymerase
MVSGLFVYLYFGNDFKARLERAWRESLQGQHKMQILWLREQKCCPICRHKITKETGWNVHHIVERVQGGSD